MGVNKDAHPTDVKRAYLRLARLYHPDVNTSVCAKVSMQIVNQAYQAFQEQLNADNFINFYQ